MNKGRLRLTLAFMAVALGVGVASAAGVDTLLWHGAHAKAVVETISDPLSIFDARSPGARRADALRQTKPGHARSRAVTPASIGPEERVLASFLDRPPERGIVAAPPLLGPDSLVGPDGRPPLSALSADTAGGPGVDSLPGPFTPGDFGAPPPPGGLFLPPGLSPPGGGVLPPGGGGPVPEPSAWAMMILAMFTVGAALRRQRRSADAAPRLAAEGAEHLASAGDRV